MIGYTLLIRYAGDRVLRPVAVSEVQSKIYSMAEEYARRADIVEVRVSMNSYSSSERVIVIKPTTKPRRRKHSE